MCKNSLVFSLAFCLSLISLQLINQFEGISIENPNTIGNSGSSKSGIKQIDPPENTYNTGFKISEDNKRFAIAGVKKDKEVKDFYLEFQRAVAKDDREKIAAQMRYPLRVYLPTDDPEKLYTFINNKKSFLKLYDKIFDEKLKELIAQIDVETEKDFWTKQEGIAIRRGEIWMSVICDKRLCEDDKYHLKIVTINGLNIFPEHLNFNDANKGN